MKCSIITQSPRNIDVTQHDCRAQRDNDNFTHSWSCPSIVVIPQWNERPRRPETWLKFGWTPFKFHPSLPAVKEKEITWHHGIRWEDAIPYKRATENVPSFCWAFWCSQILDQRKAEDSVRWYNLYGMNLNQFFISLEPLVGAELFKIIGVALSC